jgi:hypothetical protein
MSATSPPPFEIGPDGLYPPVPDHVLPHYTDAELRALLDEREAQFGAGTADCLPVAEAIAEIRTRLGL